MHPAIEHEPLPAGFEVITVGANLGAPGEIDKFQPGEDERFRLSSAIAKFRGASAAHASETAGEIKHGVRGDHRDLRDKKFCSVISVSSVVTAIARESASNSRTGFF